MRRHFIITLSVSFIAAIVVPVGEFSSFFKKNRESLKQGFIHIPEANPTFRGPPWIEAKIRILILRLSPYRDVDRSTPHLLLASEAAALPGCFVDFGFFPSTQDRRLFEENGVPLFLGLRSYKSAEDFDLVFVSNSFGLELLNLVYGFRKSGIPLFASERGSDFPPIVLGGSNALAVQALFRKTPSGLDCMADAVFFGEGEGEIAGIASILGKRGIPKQERLSQASASVPGLWVRLGGRKARKAILRAPRGGNLPAAYPVLNGEEASTARLQISFGCSSFCSFCFEGQDRKPYREVPGGDLYEAALELKRNTGASTLELYSFNFNTHTDVFALLSRLNRIFSQVNFMSQRVDFLMETPGLLAMETAAGKTGFTLGVEGVSSRIRAFYRKGLSIDTIRSAVGKLLEAKAREIKLFYILSGHEIREDFEEFRSFLKELKARRAAVNPGTRVLFSFGLLVRMPYTPLGSDRLFLAREDWKFAVSESKRDVETHGFEYRLAVPFEEYALTQVLCAGGFELSGLLAFLADKGFVYDKEIAPEAWDFAAEYLGGGLEALCGEKEADRAAPLSEVLEGTEDFLRRSWLEAKAILGGGAEEAGGRASCFEEGEGGCLGCGACADEAERASLLHHGVKPSENARQEAEVLSKLVKAKRSAAGVSVEMFVPRALAGAHAAWLEAWALRELFSRLPRTVETVFAARRETPPRDLPSGIAWYGRAVFSCLSLDTGMLEELLREASVPGFSFIGASSVPGEGLVVEISAPEPGAVRPAFTRALEGLHLTGTLSRDGGGGYDYRLSPKALKKRTVLGVKISEGRDSRDRQVFSADLMITGKFDLAEFDMALGKTLCSGAERLYRYR